MKFKVGDKVKCIEGSGNSLKYYVIKGDTYTVVDLTTTVSIFNQDEVMKVIDSKHMNRGWFYCSRFILATAYLPEELFQL